MRYYQHKTVCRANVDVGVSIKIFYDPLGNITHLEYDDYRLFLVKITDALGFETMVKYDYRALQPKEITDPNGNGTQIELDALGMPVKQAVFGANGEGDTLAHPTQAFVYNLDNWRDNAQPISSYIKARTEHGANCTTFIETYEYTDGLGRSALIKTTAEDGLAWQLNPTTGEKEEVECTSRFVASGRTVYNNKGKIFKQYEPWFSTTAAYESETELTQYGVTPVMHYDPLGRLIQTDLPDGNTTKVIFDAWQQVNYDQNDNKADHAHANTPQIQHLDSMGRLFLMQDDNGSHGTPVYIDTREQYNISGQVEQVQDAKGRWMTATLYNMLGEPIHTYNIDSGHRWQLSDVANKPIYQWDSRNHQTKYTYDSLQRPLQIELIENGSTYIVEKMVYGTDATKNNIGQIAEQYDQSGKTEFSSYDFKGNPLNTIQQFCKDYQNMIDWDSNVILQSDSFSQSFVYDAMNRMLQHTQPNGIQIAQTYNKAGLLESITKDGQYFVNNINYNEKGQRTAIYYGNNTKTKYEYDINTFRLIRLLTTRNNGADILQDLNYTYDPVGNITQIIDKAQQTHYFNNSVINPISTYKYDALYRLVEAKGRELKGLQMPTHNNFANSIPLPNTASNAMQNYIQQFQYDELGNMMQMKSVGKWTRDYFYNESNNYLLGHTANTTEYTYDQHGNMLSLPHLSEMVWDYKDELKEVDLDGGGTAYYVYDATGERVRKIIEKGNIVEERYYINGYEVYRKTTNGNLNVERKSLFIKDNTKTIVQIDSDGTNETIRYQYDNHLGSASLELDHNASIISYEEYHPFGTTSYRSGRTETEVSQKRYKYVGKERDEETGLYYYGARYYAGWIGRFVSVDPLADHPKNITNSPYCYVNNNPLNNIDPSGMIWDETNGSDKKAKSFEKKLTKKQESINEEINKISDILNNTKGLNEKKLDKYQNQLVNLKAKRTEVSHAITELAKMEGAKDVVFRLERPRNDHGTETYRNTGSGFIQEGIDSGKTFFENGKVVMQYDWLSDDAMAHELKHGYQFLVGELSFDKSTGGPGLLYDLTDEQAAWKRGSLFSTGLTDAMNELAIEDLKELGYSTNKTKNLSLVSKTSDVLQNVTQKYKSSIYGNLLSIISGMPFNDITIVNLHKL